VIEVYKSDLESELKMRLAKGEEFALRYYQDNTFSWLLTSDEATRRGRSDIESSLKYFLINFKEEGNGNISALGWAWDEDEIFVKE